MKLIVLATALALASGCTTFHVRQTDETPDSRKITTDLRATSIFNSSQSIARLKALQTDKTQSFGSDSMGQTANSSNAVKFIDKLDTIMLRNGM